MKKILFLITLFACLTITGIVNGVNVKTDEIKLSTSPATIKKSSAKTLKQPARISGKITALTTNQITVSADDGKKYQINITSQTKFRRKFWGTSKLSEFSIGDQVKVVGRFLVNSADTINAVIVRNLSIEKRWGAYFGEITKKNETNFVIKTKKRGELTIYFTSQTKFVSRDNKTINYKDVKTGDRVRIKGIWDGKLNKITEVDQVKDFSTPPKPAPTNSI